MLDTATFPQFPVLEGSVDEEAATVALEVG
jgi:hypothetical protein